MSDKDNRKQNFMTCDFYIGVSNLLASIKGQNKELIVVVKDKNKTETYGLLIGIVKEEYNTGIYDCVEVMYQSNKYFSNSEHIRLEDIKYIEWFVRDLYE